MIRLYFYVEGATEAAFVQRVLKPHLARCGVMVMGVALASTGRRHHQVRRGGGRHYPPARNDLVRQLRHDRGDDVRFTTLFDLYALYSDFPGTEEANKQRHVPYDRVRTLETAFGDDIGDRRFIPHIQLYEFEALLFCEPGAFERVYDEAGRSVEKLRQIAADVQSPELIDDGQHTAPSKRIAEVFPQYARNKVRDGVAVAELIPLEKMRTQCPHFGRWLCGLEQLGQEPGPEAENHRPGI